MEAGALLDWNDWNVRVRLDCKLIIAVVTSDAVFAGLGPTFTGEARLWLPWPKVKTLVSGMRDVAGPEV